MSTLKNEDEFTSTVISKTLKISNEVENLQNLLIESSPLVTFLPECLRIQNVMIGVQISACLYHQEKCIENKIYHFYTFEQLFVSIITLNVIDSCFHKVNAPVMDCGKLNLEICSLHLNDDMLELNQLILNLDNPLHKKYFRVCKILFEHVVKTGTFINLIDYIDHGVNWETLFYILNLCIYK